MSTYSFKNDSYILDQDDKSEKKVACYIVNSIHFSCRLENFSSHLVLSAGSADVIASFYHRMP